MRRHKIIFALVIAFSTLTLTSCASYQWDAGKPCIQVAVDPNTDPNCIAGGSKCGTCEGQMCNDGWFYNYYCTTVKLVGGTCVCRCQ